MLEHGGRLRRAAAASHTRVEDWLDLSTGVSPHPWPAPAPPAECWARLPEEEDELLPAARAYYGVDELLAVPGTQAAIQGLPRLRPPGRVAVLGPTYAEHAHAWAREGHATRALDLERLEARLDRCEVVVVVNPDNPGGRRLQPDRLREWHAALAARGGWLVVDEAFMDPTPEASLLADAGAPGLVVLRSFGKFFGAPGARLGFVAAWPALLGALRELLGPWPVAGPSRWIGARALADRAWQDEARTRLAADSRRLAALLEDHGLPPSGGAALFQTCPTPAPQALADHCARHRILIRVFTEPGRVRLGLPGSEADWARLARALAGRPDARGGSG